MYIHRVYLLRLANLFMTKQGVVFELKGCLIIASYFWNEVKKDGRDGVHHDAMYIIDF